MRITHLLALLIFLSCMLPSRIAAQQLLQLDPTPLARPSALTTYTMGDAAKVLRAVSKTLTDFGFNLTRSDAGRGEVEATQVDSGSSDESDHVLIWIERDLANPMQQISLYFLYGRYARVQGHAQPERIVSSSNLEDQRVGKLKSALVSLTF